MQRLMLLGLNHTTAPLTLREKLVFDSAERADALRKIRAAFPQSEAVLLSTCNRVELYVCRPVHDHPRAEEIGPFLAGLRGINAELFAREIQPHLYHKTQRDAAEHLFTVASSLDSMVIGETQILGQVRDAYAEARQVGIQSGLLNTLFQRAIAVGKQVMTQTALGDGRLSVASVAVDYARRIFESFTDKTVLTIGAGKMTGLVLRHIAALGPGRLIVCNRDEEKAARLAEQFGGQPAPLEKLAEHLVAADIVITSTGSHQPIITRELFEGLRRGRRDRPIFLIDLALPRDIDPGVAGFNNVYLYNLDDLQQVVSGTQASRQDAIDAAHEILAHHLAEYERGQRTRELGPVIDALYKRAHDIARQELARTAARLPNLSAEEREHLEDLARRIVNKMLHDPVTTLRESDAMHNSTDRYLHAMELLFKLSETLGGKIAPPPPVDGDQ